MVSSGCYVFLIPVVNTTTPPFCMKNVPILVPSVPKAPGVKLISKAPKMYPKSSAGCFWYYFGVIQRFCSVHCGILVVFWRVLFSQLAGLLWYITWVLYWYTPGFFLTKKSYAHV